MDKQIDILIRVERGSGTPRHIRCGGKDCLDVRDLLTRVTIRIRAEEVSPYRHTLMMDGMAYEILNVFRPA